MVAGACLDESRLGKFDAVGSEPALRPKHQRRTHYGEPKNRPSMRSFGRVMRYDSC